MASFIYFYSKFTEEFLLLSAAGIFTLLSIYCYTWVVKKRRLGAARDQVPAGLVKIYLSQLINEAQFVRTQLFGLAGGAAPTLDSFAAHFQAGTQASGNPNQNSSSVSGAMNGEIPTDLLERLKALETQLAEKESMVVNINVEKSKLLEEVENLKQNEKVMGSPVSGAAGNNDDLLKKMKALEERLEEYALFEDDLANLKRLQQENAQLKKQIEKPSPQVEASAPAASIPDTAPEQPANMLDQDAIEALLDGKTAVPPTPSASTQMNPSEEQGVKGKHEIAEPIDMVAASLAAAKKAEPIIEAAPAPAPEASVKGTPKGEDQFEHLVDSIESSLGQDTRVEESTAEEMLAAPAQSASQLAEKSDEELLKEFENLLNS